MSTPETLPTDPQELVAHLVMANVDALASTTDRIIDLLTVRAEEAEATLALIRGGIADLLDGDYAPTSAALERALWPSSARVAAIRARKEIG